MIPIKLLLCAVGLALVCGAFVSGFSWRDSEVAVARQQADNAARAGDNLRESFEASVAELTRERDEARELSQKLDAEVGQLAQKLAESQAAAVQAAANARAQPSIGNQGSPGSSMKTLAEVFKKPEMKDVVVQQNLAQLDMIYGKLYDRLQLDNSEKQDLKNLLSERMRAELEVSMFMMSGDVSPQKAVASGQEILKANALIKVGEGFSNAMGAGARSTMGILAKGMGFVGKQFSAAVKDELEDMQARGSLFGSLKKQGVFKGTTAEEDTRDYRQTKRISRINEEVIGNIVRESPVSTATVSTLNRQLTDNLLHQSQR